MWTETLLPGREPEHLLGGWLGKPHLRPGGTGYGSALGFPLEAAGAGWASWSASGMAAPSDFSPRERERKRENDTVGLRLVVNKYLVSRGHFNYVNVTNTEASGWCVGWSKAEALDYKNVKKTTWYHFAIFMLLNNHIWRSGAYTLFLMMSFFCCTEWGLLGLKRTKCSAVRSCASPTTGGSFFPDTDTSSSAISWPSPGEHTHTLYLVL